MTWTTSESGAEVLHAEASGVRLSASAFSGGAAVTICWPGYTPGTGRRVAEAMIRAAISELEADQPIPFTVAPEAAE